jgi:hypothetical protein
MLSIHLRPGLPSGLFPSGFPTNNLLQLHYPIGKNSMRLTVGSVRVTNRIIIALPWLGLVSQVIQSLLVLVPRKLNPFHIFENPSFNVSFNNILHFITGSRSEVFLSEEWCVLGCYAVWLL